MAYEAIFARSFSRQEQKKLGWGALVGCLIIALSVCTVFRPYIGPLPVLNLRMSMGGEGLRILMTTEDTNDREPLYIKIEEVQPICNISEPRSDQCQMVGDIRIDGNSSTIFVVSTQYDNFEGNNSWSIRPYARKTDETAMGNVRRFTVEMTNVSKGIPQCTKNQSVPAIVFSTGGYVGNHFHEFTDVLIPLFLTSWGFNGQVQFLISKTKSWWISKYEAVLKKLSRYEIIDIDKEEGVLCFPRMIVGLKTHKEFDIDPSKPPYYSMTDFRQFLRNSYSLKRETAIKLRDGSKNRKPRLLIVSRTRTRVFINKDKIAGLGRRLGYDVIITEADGNLSRFAELVNSCDVMLGVHGAGLTNIVYLPENAIVIQVVPLGEMNWLANTFFGEPAKDMNLRYLEYKISEGESSLIKQYPIDHEVFRDPNSISKKGWDAFRSVYLDKQDVNIDITRFRKTLVEALKLLHVSSK